MNKSTETQKKAGKQLDPVSFSFDSAALVKRLLAPVPERARDVLVRRFGLGANAKRETLESIGDRSGITRERVRQIEAAGLEAVRKSKAFKEARSAFDELVMHVTSLGVIVSEEVLLSSFGKDEKARNRFRFFLVVDSSFFRERETNDFLARWHVDHATAKNIHAALSKLYTSLSDDEVVSEAEILNRFLEELKTVNDAYKNEEILKRWH